MKKTKTQAEKDYHAKVARVGCVICDRPTNLHHPRKGIGKGEFLVIALCQEHHQGEFSLHSSKREFMNVYGDEAFLLNETLKRVFTL